MRIIRVADCRLRSASLSEQVELILLLSVLLNVHLRAAAVVLLGIVSHVAVRGSAVLAPPDGEVSHIPHSGLGGDVELMNV